VGSSAHGFVAGPGLNGAHTQRKVPPRGGTFLALTPISELAILIRLLALTVWIRTIWILLLLAGPLAAALLLAGLLTRCLVLLTRGLALLARLLVLTAHSGISLVERSLG
jgi:hypothetical protein